MNNEALSSNVVNYLVWRYLQEAGYGNAALQLSRCWIRDPECLPFAKNVAPHTLINLLQDGLWFDRLQAEASSGEHRYHFGRDHGRPYSIRNGEALTLDQGIPAHVLAEEATNGAVQPPAPRKGPGKGKRKRQINGVAELQMMNPQINGDAMDVDQNGHTNVTNSVRAESASVVSEAESPTVAELPISTLSIGQSTEIQTEKIADLTPGTTFTSVKDPEKTVLHTTWGSPDSQLLLSAGKNLFRFHHLPKSSDSNAVASPPTHDLTLSLNNFTVTAVCWNSRDEVTVAAQEEKVNADGEKLKTDKLLRIVEGGQDVQVLSTMLATTTAVRWYSSTQALLAVATTGATGNIRIWKGDDLNPSCTVIIETPVLDAAWMTETAFVVCGEQFFQIYEIVDNELKVRQSFTTKVIWETVKYDAPSGIIAAAAMDGKENLFGIVHPNEPTNLQTQQYPDPYFTDFAFRPRPDSESGSKSTRVVLAAGAASGVTRLWDANEPFKCLKRLVMEEESQVNNVEFSPDGTLLAAAGPDLVTIWNIDERDVPIASWNWKERTSDWDSSVDGEPSLGWDPDGSRLSIALGNQIVIINVPR